MVHPEVGGYIPEEAAEFVAPTEREEVPAPERFYRATQEYNDLAHRPELDFTRLNTIISDMRETARSYAQSFISPSISLEQLRDASNSLDFIGHRIGEIVDAMPPEIREQLGYDYLLSLSHINGARFDLQQRVLRLERNNQRAN